MEERLKDRQRMLELMTGYLATQGVYVAAKLGIADILVEGPQTALALATATHTNVKILKRLLHALASVGVFSENNDDTYSLTSLSSYLLSDSPESLRNVAIMTGEILYKILGSLQHAVQTGEPTFERDFGQPVYDYISNKPVLSACVSDAVEEIHADEVKALSIAHDFAAYETVVDVGAGHGAVIIELLNRYPQLKGVLFDRPEVLSRTKERIAKAGLSDRCELCPGDFFASVPRGGDAYLLRHVIHDWDDASAIAILQNCRKAMTHGATLLLAEGILPMNHEPYFGKWLYLMEVLLCGQERTEQQYRALLAASGFRVKEVVKTNAEISIIEAALNEQEGIAC